MVNFSTAAHSGSVAGLKPGSVFTERSFSAFGFFARCRSFPEAVLVIFMEVLFVWVGFFFSLSISGAQALVKLLGLTQSPPEEGQPLLRLGSSRVRRNSAAVPNTSGENLFSLKDQVAVNVMYFFLRKYLDLPSTPPQFFEPREVSCCPLRCSCDYTWV